VASADYIAQPFWPGQSGLDVLGAPVGGSINVTGQWGWYAMSDSAAYNGGAWHPLSSSPDPVYKVTVRIDSVEGCPNMRVSLGAHGAPGAVSEVHAAAVGLNEFRFEAGPPANAVSSVGVDCGSGYVGSYFHASLTSGDAIPGWRTYFGSWNDSDVPIRLETAPVSSSVANADGTALASGATAKSPSVTFSGRPYAPAGGAEAALQVQLLPPGSSFANAEPAYFLQSVFVPSGSTATAASGVLPPRRMALARPLR